MISQSVAFGMGFASTLIGLGGFSWAWHRWTENRQLRHIKDTYDRETERRERLGEMFYGLL